MNTVAIVGVGLIGGSFGLALRKAGFNAAVDTQDAFCAALQSFIDRKLLPPTLQ